MPALSGTVICALAFAAVGAPWFAPHDPYDQDPAKRLMPPFASRAHMLGTDYVGRDILSRLVWAARPSLAVGGITVLLTGSLGVILGLLGGYYGGPVDTVVRAVINIRLAFPFILLVLTVVAILGPGLRNTILTLSATLWVNYAVVVRNQVLILREQEFVAAGRALGGSSLHIIWRHVLPNLTGSVLVVASYGVVEAILAESFLSFLGLGVQSPAPSWGNMLAEGRAYALSLWWLSGIPGAAIFVTTLSLILFGDALRDVLDPLRRRS